MFNLFSKKSKTDRVYLDYASITPIDKRVLDIVQATYTEFPANPSSIYTEGVQASKKLESARLEVAKALEVHADEIYFTGGGTEGNNLAVAGVLKGFLFNAVPAEDEKKNKPHIISTNIEHPSIREILLHLSKMGVCDVSFIPVEENGLINPKDIRMALRPETVLVSVMYVNNEIGTIQPIAEIAKALRHFKKEQGRTVYSYPYLHTDACQAGQYCSLRVPTLGADLLTLDGSKIYGPRGSGALYIRRGIPVEPLMYGGDQESGVRPSTEDVPNAVGFAYALTLCRDELESESVRVLNLRNELYVHIKTELAKGGVEIKTNGLPVHKVPNNINICIPGIDSEFAVLKLDANGVAVSSVTSCRTKKEDSRSYVIEALESARGDFQKDEEKIKNHVDGSPLLHGCSQSSLRITLGRFTTKKEICMAKGVIVSVLKRLVEFKTPNKQL